MKEKEFFDFLEIQPIELTDTKVLQLFNMVISEISERGNRHISVYNNGKKFSVDFSTYDDRYHTDNAEGKDFKDCVLDLCMKVSYIKTEIIKILEKH